MTEKVAGRIRNPQIPTLIPGSEGMIRIPAHEYVRLHGTEVFADVIIVAHLKIQRLSWHNLVT